MINEDGFQACIKLGCFFVPGQTQDDYIVFLPAAKSAFGVSVDKIRYIEESALAYCSGKECDRTLKLLFDRSVQGLSLLKERSKSTCMESVLYISPTLQCNFNCSYCYSASGRSKQNIDISKAKDIISAFIKTRNNNIKLIRIVYIGGGEPLLNFNAVRQLTDFAKLCAYKQNINILFTIITNGSLLTRDIIEWLNDNDIRLNISFEILPEEQLKLRGNFKNVMNGINLLKAFPGVCNHTLIRSTITDANVKCQLRMLQHAKSFMPWITRYSFEPVTDASFLCNGKIARSFLSDFAYEYEKAKNYSINVNFKLSTSFESHCERFVDHACSGQFGLTPFCSLTSCGCVTSPNEPYYASTVLKAEPDNIENFFKSEYQCKASTRKQCDDCYARYSCAGGCFVQNNLYNDEVKQEICESEKSFLRNFLIKKINR